MWKATRSWPFQLQLSRVFAPGVPQRLFNAKGAFSGRGQRYDVSADGEKFVLVEPLEGDANYVIRVVLNWYEEFRDREQN